VHKKQNLKERKEEMEQKRYCFVMVMLTVVSY